MKSLTIAYCTARKEPMIEWFLDSLSSQLNNDHAQILIVDFHHSVRDSDFVSKIENHRIGNMVDMVPVKPNVWQGEHRIPKDQWWAKSAYLNTAICLCETEWIAFVDDRCVLAPTWIAAVKNAMDGNYAVAGAYEKRINMKVESGSFGICDYGQLIGTDPRHMRGRSYITTGSNWFGCTNALPLEWALQVNGFDESCDSLGMEDVVFGAMISNNGFPIKYDPKMKIIEDRTSLISDSVVKRTDKGISPKDKSHAILKRIDGKKQATHHWNLREIRDRVLRGEPFPIPDQPLTDWHDGQPLIEFP